MDTTDLSFGEYQRRLRRGKGWNLQQLAERTGISYTHLSRIENDSTIPNADTVAKIATALQGQLKTMLELADCLPRVILDRIAALEEHESGVGILERGISSDSAASSGPVHATIAELCQQAGISAADMPDLASAIEEFLQLPAAQRSAVRGLISTLFGDAYGDRR